LPGNAVAKKKNIEYFSEFLPGNAVAGQQEALDSLIHLVSFLVHTPYSHSCIFIIFW